MHAALKSKSCWQQESMSEASAQPVVALVTGGTLEPALSAVVQEGETISQDEVLKRLGVANLDPKCLEHLLGIVPGIVSNNADVKREAVRF